MSRLLAADAEALWAPAQFGPKRPWTAADAAHLYRRAAFGADIHELEASRRDGLQATLDLLFTPPPKDDPAERESAGLARAVLAGGDVERLSQWWLHRLLNGSRPLREKATLFWHGHFATSARKVDDPQAMMDHHKLLREHALGPFEPFVQAMSRDPAMLVWLDSTTSRKGKPNENYARELMELFCLGAGVNAYTEKDVQEAARAFTGWEVQQGRFRFHPQRHDDGPKVLLGRRGNWNGDDAVRIVLEQPAAARFIARKLARFYVCDEPFFTDEEIEPLASDLRRNGFHVQPVLRRILASEKFFSAEARTAKVRSPVELAISLLHSLEGSANLIPLAEQLEALGQALFFPPNVKGWDGGRAWINTASLLGRVQLVHSILSDSASRFGGGSLADYFARHGLERPDDAVQKWGELTLAAPLPPEAQSAVSKAAERTDVSRPEALRGALCLLAAQPEFQLN